jgi:hypothetical protein
VTGVCAQLGDGDAAGRLSERFALWAGHHLAASHLYLGAADHHLGILNAVAGRWEDGLAHLQAAAMDAVATATAGRLGMELPGWRRPALGPRS